MEVFLGCNEREQRVYIMARVEDPALGAIGHIRHYICPGERYAGRTYEEFMALGTGWHELTIPKTSTGDKAAPAANTPATAS